MILLISDVHSRFGLINTQIAHAEARFAETVTSVVVTGDFGLFSGPLQRFFVTEGSRFLRPVYYVEGNHEDFAHFTTLNETYRQHFTHLPRGEVRIIDGIRFLGFGGASYMNPLLTPPASVIRDADIDRCLRLAPGSVDYLVGHDCPRGLPIAGSPQFDHLGPPGFPRGFDLARHLRVPIWVFGHHHQWHSSSRDGTRYEGLSESWHGYAVIKRKRRYTAVENLIPLRPPRSLLQRLLTGLFRHD